MTSKLKFAATRKILYRLNADEKNYSPFKAGMVSTCKLSITPCGAVALEKVVLCGVMCNGIIDCLSSLTITTSYCERSHGFFFAVESTNSVFAKRVWRRTCGKKT
jgi:hypothetical protein